MPDGSVCRQSEWVSAQLIVDGVIAEMKVQIAIFDAERVGIANGAAVVGQVLAVDHGCDGERSERR